MITQSKFSAQVGAGDYGLNYFLAELFFGAANEEISWTGKRPRYATGEVPKFTDAPEKQGAVHAARQKIAARLLYGALTDGRRSLHRLDSSGEYYISPYMGLRGEVGGFAAFLGVDLGPLLAARKFRGYSPTDEFQAVVDDCLLKFDPFGVKGTLEFCRQEIGHLLAESNTDWVFDFTA